MIDTSSSIFARILGAVVDVGFAVSARVSWHAHASVIVQFVVADSTVLTWIRSTLVDIRLTSFSTIACNAVADVLIDSILTTTIHTRIAVTLVDIAEATSIVISTRTLALESVDHVNTNSTVGTWLRCTFIDIGLTVNTSESWRTCTRITIDSIDTLSSIAARIAVTFVDIDLTIWPGCSRKTSTTITSDQIFAMSTMLARIRFALVDLDLTVLTRVSWIAFTFVRVLAVDAMTPVAGIAVAFVDVYFTR